MKNPICAVLLWLLLLPGLLASWGTGIAPATVHSDAEKKAASTSRAVPAAESAQNTDSDEPVPAIPTPVYLSVAASVTLPTAVLSGLLPTATEGTWALQDFVGHALPSFFGLHYTSRHTSMLRERALRLRTWFTRLMPAQAP